MSAVALPAALRRPLAHDRVRALAVALVLLALTWAALPLTPTTGFDPAWQAALHMGANGTHPWGSDLVFTYGPLGFLKIPTYWYDGTGRLAVLYAFATTLALLAVLWVLGRHSFGALGAFVLLLVVGRYSGDAVQVIAFAVALWVVLVEQPARRVTAFAAGAGALAGIELLGKANTGAVVLAMAVLAVAAQPRGSRGRPAAVLAGSVLVALVALWLVAGQPPGALPAHVFHTGQIVSGYSAAMGLEDASLKWQYPLVLLTVLAGSAGVWLAARPRPTRVGVAALALWLVFSFMLFKEGFVRHDGHETIYFATMVGALVAVPWGRGLRALAGVAAIAIPLAALWITTDQRIGSVFTPVASLGDAASDLATVFDAGRREELRETGRRNAMAALGLDPRMLALLRGRSVAVEPSESDAAWVYRLRWRPLRVMHSNVAYGTELDELDADQLASSDAPERILWRLEPPLDRRVPAFDPPATRRAMLCRYAPLGAQPPWIVLGRTADRCGPARRVAMVRAGWGEPVDVPPPSRRETMTFVRVHGVDVGGLERVRAFLFKARFRWIYLDGREYRLVPGTADDGLLLSAPAGDYPKPFALAPNPRRMAVRVDGGAGGRLRYEFFEAPLSR